MFVVKKLIGGVLLVAAIFVSSPLHAGDKDVIVINTPDVNVVNSPFVNVANEPGVNVINDATSPIPVEIQNGAQTIVEWRYIGLTEHADVGRWQFGGLVGVAAMNKACADDYGPGARAANISEAYFRDDFDTETQDAWLVPNGPMLVILVDQNKYRAHDAQTGLEVGRFATEERFALGLAYCAKYLQDTGQGGIAENGPVSFWEYGSLGRGVLGAALCDESRPAACSAPVAIPVTLLP